jgi:signal transduction histidine kinase
MEKKQPSSPSTEAWTVRLAATLLHDLRNSLNAITLEAADLREQAEALGVRLDATRMAAIVRDLAEGLRILREHLEPSTPRLESYRAVSWAEALRADALAKWNQPGACELHWPPIEDSDPCLASAWVEVDAQQIATAIDALLENAMLASKSVHAAWRIRGGEIILSFRNRVDEAPENVRLWGTLGYSTRRKHLGLGCRFARVTAEAHHGNCTWRFDPADGDVTAALTLPLRMEGKAEP